VFDAKSFRWSSESAFKGWQLFCIFLVTFPPSKDFEAYLRSFMTQRTTHSEGRVDVIAKYCLRRLTLISKKGPRGKALTPAEIETALVKPSGARFTWDLTPYS